MKAYLFAFLLASLSLQGIELGEEAQQITVHNRILGRVHGRTISVLDVMKKMDVYLARAYPDLAKSPAVRYQFFSANWRQVFTQMVDNELILADAEQVKLKITDKEIRETLYERFGPNIMPTLDLLGISYEEAWQMIFSEMAVQRMTYFRVHSKAFQHIRPNDIKAYYKQYLEEHPPSHHQKYQLLSIRASNQSEGDLLAEKAHHLLTEEKLPFEQVVEKLKEISKATIQLSKDYDIPDKDLSEDHKKALLTIAAPGQFSAPISQVSRSDQMIVHRIFFLKERREIKPPSFDEMTEKLHDELMQKEVNKEFPNYLNRLRRRFNIDEKSIETLPRDFQPFSLR